MRHIESSSLWIGNVRDGKDIRALFDHGIKASVDLAYEEPPTVLPREIVNVRLPLMDGPGNPMWLLQSAIDFTAQLVRAHVTALIFCSMGMSRSPCIAATALALARGGNPDEYLALLTASRPADIAPGLWAEALIAFGALRQTAQEQV